VALAFGMRVRAMTAHPERYRQDWPQVRFGDLAQLRRECDIVSLHCPLNEETCGLVNRDFILDMKPGALLINTARGQVVDEPAVAAALHAGELAGYAADVLGCEPPAADHPLLDAPHTFLTPHIAWGTVAARRRLIAIALDNLRSFVEGGRKNRLV
jgi:glycerate dehydrogenase